VERLGGRLVTPGLIDCHTHLVFAGDRSGEFEARLQGATYQQIAASGGGILSTVRATRSASEDELVESAADRLASLLREGVTTVEVKSGYGLDLDTELKMLRAARRLASRCGVRVRTTYLGLHALPPEFADGRGAYVDLVVNGILPAVAAERLADAVDAYVEPIAFTAAEAERFFDAAARFNLPVKLHAEQFSDSGGTELAARHRALSADHLEYASPDAVEAMAQAGTVAVLLPGAFVELRETRAPPVEALRAAGVPMAVATDCNPGTSPVTSLLSCLHLGCVLFRLTPEEALLGATRNAAQALGLTEEVGTIEVGKAADLAVWDVASPGELSYWLGRSRLVRRYVGGRPA
jgi:imidazolonepropionase